MNFYQILILIIIGTIAIRFTFKFDLNKYLENGREIRIDRLKNICPHCKIEFVGNKQVKVESYFSKPRGTFRWICGRCRCIVDSEEDAVRICKNYAKDPKRFLANEKRFIKEMEKLGLA